VTETPTKALRANPVGRQRAWQSMRILRRFCLQDLVTTANTTLSNVRPYVAALERAGYIRRDGMGKCGGQGERVQYRLMRDTGPLAPSQSRSGIRDLNPGALEATDGR
jgi:hypothetical protein